MGLKSAKSARTAESSADLCSASGTALGSQLSAVNPQPSAVSSSLSSGFLPQHPAYLSRSLRSFLIIREPESQGWAVCARARPLSLTWIW